MSDAPAVLTAAPQQREILRQALADAIYYRDPPLQCPACASPDRLCGQCAAGHERARAYWHSVMSLGWRHPHKRRSSWPGSMPALPVPSCAARSAADGGRRPTTQP